MSGNFKKEDLRIVKTRAALVNAMLALLERRTFGKITVFDLCNEALVSRAAFYTHFTDKYDLLGHWLLQLRNTLMESLCSQPGEETEILIDEFIGKRRNVLANLVADADKELLSTLSGMLSAPADVVASDNADEAEQLRRTALANFYAGGLMSLLWWQAKRNFPAKDRVLIPYICEMMKALFDWDMNHA
ncbi:MAG: TetR/AcrR family transcriptional regulator [Clostridiales Family XIII bacterium]|jgi:AcrR family transcriptional regulator|nr:TetR/AcrR family transcriptional regulator [Clostridiales Family XIII bacterium]